MFHQFCFSVSLVGIRKQVTFKGGREDCFGIDGSVNTGSGLYSFGDVVGNLVGGTALYSGAAFKYIPALGVSSSFIGHPAYGGNTIRSLRSGARFGWGRNNGPVLRFAYRDKVKVDILRK